MEGVGGRTFMGILSVGVRWRMRMLGVSWWMWVMVVLWRVWWGELTWMALGGGTREGVPHRGVLGRFSRDGILCSFGGIWGGGERWGEVLCG